MNRKLEYQELLQELDKTVPELEFTLERAYAKKRRRNRIIRSFASIAATFALFVVLVNFCTPVAYACSKVPFLRDLAEAVTFSRSLSDAVDNEYVQPMYLTQTVGDITASVEYLIVDQKQVNVFFSLDSEVYTKLGVNPDVVMVDDAYLKCSYGFSSWGEENGELRRLEIDFTDEDVPDKIKLGLKAYSQFPLNDDTESTVIPYENVNDILFEDHSKNEPKILAEFEFILEFDPDFTRSGKKVSVNQTIELDGQQITITNIEIYPTHLRVNVEDDKENTAWLKRLDFYIETGFGKKFDAPSNGVTATGTTDSPAMVSFRTDSTWFYDVNRITIVITGAEWLNKDMEKVYVNLKTGETDALPEGVTFHSAVKEEEGWIVSFEGGKRSDKEIYSIFYGKYFDMDGTEHNINSWGTSTGDTYKDGKVVTFMEKFPLKGYFEDEVYLAPIYSHVWKAKEPVKISVELNK